MYRCIKNIDFMWAAISILGFTVSHTRAEVPHIFNAGQSASATQVNENFSALVTAIGDITVSGSGITSGVGAPSADSGVEGDFYWDSSARALYGPKALEGWGTPMRVGHVLGVEGDNTAVGLGALEGLTSGHANVAVGKLSLSRAGDASDNTALGNGSLIANEANQNTAVGSRSLMSNVQGYRNVAMGVGALANNVSGFENVAIGTSSMAWNTDGSSNTAMGAFALYENTSAVRNTSIGFHSMFSNTTGRYNTALGYSALFNNVSGANNTAIGYGAGPSEGQAELSNTIALGASAVVTESNTAQIGNTELLRISTAAALTTGSVTYPNVTGLSGQVLSTDGESVAGWRDEALSYSNIYLVTDTDVAMCADENDILLNGGCQSSGALSSSHPVESASASSLSGWQCVSTSAATAFATCISR